jgi:hypothetical protein
MRSRQTASFSLVVVWITFGAAGAVWGDNVFRDDLPYDPGKARFVIEAEDYSSRSNTPAAGWWEVDGGDNALLEGPKAGQAPAAPRWDAKGNCMEVTGGFKGGAAPTDRAEYDGPYMDYIVAITKPGTYRLYVRWMGQDGSTDSLYAYILKPDGTVLTDAGPEYFAFHQFRSSWYWDTKGVQDSPSVAYAGFPHEAVWRIPRPGNYTIRIAGREPEVALDSLVFQTDGLPAPGESRASGRIGVPQRVVGELGLASGEPRRVVDEPAADGSPQSVRARLKLQLDAKRAALQQIELVLARDGAVSETLSQLLATGQYWERSAVDVSRSMQSLAEAIQSEQLSRATLQRAIEQTQRALEALNEPAR